MRRPRPATIEASRHDALNGVALTVRNSQLDKSASVRVAELLTVMVSSNSRRNVLGAIALKRTIATSRSDDNRDGCQQANKTKPLRKLTRNKRRPNKALPVRNDRDGDRSPLTDSFRNGHIVSTQIGVARLAAYDGITKAGNTADPAGQTIPFAAA
jgi:hypothetical protein